MATKRKKSLSMVPRSQRFNREVTERVPRGIERWNPSRVETPGEKQIVEKQREHVLMQAGFQDKAAKANYLYKKLHRDGAGTMDQIAGNIAACQDMKRSPNHQDLMDEFLRDQGQLAKNHVLGVLDVAGTRIAQLVHESLEPEKQAEPEPLSIWEQLFGRRK